MSVFEISGYCLLASAGCFTALGLGTLVWFAGHVAVLWWRTR